MVKDSSPCEHLMIRMAICNNGWMMDGWMDGWGMDGLGTNRSCTVITYPAELI